MSNKLKGQSIYDHKTNIIYEKITTDEYPFKLIDVNTPKDNINLIPPKHWHNSIEFILPLSATIEVWQNGESIIVPRNSLAIINSKAIHTTNIVESDDMFKSIVLQIKYDVFKELYPDFDNVMFSTSINKDIEIELCNYVINIRNEYSSNNEFSKLILKGYITLFIGTLLKNQVIQKSPLQNSIEDKGILDVLKYIDENYNKDLDMEEIAKLFNFSYGYLARLFKRHLNMSMKQYLTHRRLEHSVKDIVHTNKSVTEIALANGFPDVREFNKEFKKRYNRTALSYRKEVRK